MNFEGKVTCTRRKQYATIFSGFSVGCCINEEKVICYQLELGKNFANVSTECSSHHQGPDDDWSIQSKRRQVIF